MSGVAKVSLAGKAAGSSSNSIGTLTGDVTAGPATAPDQSVAATLAAVGTAQTIGDATHYPIVTTDVKGRVTAMTAQAVSAPALTSDSKSLSATVSVPASTLTTFLTTNSLAVGTWLINMNAQLIGSSLSALFECDIKTVLGTATATITGQSSASLAITSGSSNVGTYMIGVSFIVVVTVAGTLEFQAEANQATTVDDVTNSFNYPNATGYTAVKIG